ncbi:MAG: hypothetical protein PHY92_05845 [Alphaproteobacteria bacterium]|nr:hypothetical protein [Alphaproteobacteria bacterium]
MGEDSVKNAHDAGLHGLPLPSTSSGREIEAYNIGKGHHGAIHDPITAVLKLTNAPFKGAASPITAHGPTSGSRSSFWEHVDFTGMIVLITLTIAGLCGVGSIMINHAAKETQTRKEEQIAQEEARKKDRQKFEAFKKANPPITEHTKFAVLTRPHQKVILFHGKTTVDYSGDIPKGTKAIIIKYSHSRREYVHIKIPSLKGRMANTVFLVSDDDLTPAPEDKTYKKPSQDDRSKNTEGNLKRYSETKTELLRYGKKQHSLSQAANRPGMSCAQAWRSQCRV